jgi:hypothetical protein
MITKQKVTISTEKIKPIVTIIIKEVGNEQISMNININPSMTLADLQDKYPGLAYSVGKAIMSIKEDCNL